MHGSQMRDQLTSSLQRLQRELSLCTACLERPALLTALGKVRSAMWEEAAAHEAFQSAIELSVALKRPNDDLVAGWREVGDSLHRLHRFDESIAAYHRASALATGPQLQDLLFLRLRREETVPLQRRLLREGIVRYQRRPV